MFSLDAGPIGVVMTLVVIVLVLAFIGSRYKVAGPNEAIIIAGAKGSKMRKADGTVEKTDDDNLRVVVGTGVVVLPIIQRDSKLSLKSLQTSIVLEDGVTAQGIKVRVSGNAVFKVASTAEGIRKAAQRFVDQESQIEPMVKQVLQGSLRSIVGSLSIEDLVTNRASLMDAVTTEARRELDMLGLALDVFNLQDIADTGFEGQESYIAQLGKKNFQTARRDAEIAEAAAQKEIITAQRDQALRQAEADSQTQAASAKAAQAGPLAQAEAAQEVTRRQTELAVLEAKRREQELLATTVKQAAAEAEAAIERARGERQAKIAQAEAEAAKVRIEGEAAASAVFAKGRAEAEAMALKAEAYRAYNEAAILSAVLERLPDMIREAAAPMAQIGSLTVLSSDGASEVVRNATRTVAEAQTVVKSLTGIDLPALVGGALKSSSKGGDPKNVATMAAKMSENYANSTPTFEAPPPRIDPFDSVPAAPAEAPAPVAAPAEAPASTAAPVEELMADLDPMTIAKTAIGRLSPAQRTAAKRAISLLPDHLESTPVSEIGGDRIHKALMSLDPRIGELTLGELRSLL